MNPSPLNSSNTDRSVVGQVLLHSLKELSGKTQGLISHIQKHEKKNLNRTGR